jgi:hypothetical protein
MEKSLENINPSTHIVPIGRETLRDLKILPVALGGFLDMTDLVEQIFAEFMGITMDDEGKPTPVSDMAMASFAKNAIKNNVSLILPHVINEDEEVKSLLNEITLPQLATIIDIVYEANYAETEKKLNEGILKKFQRKVDSIPSEKSSPPLAENMP